MGIDTTVIDFLLYAEKYVQNRDNLLTLGRQGIHISTATINKISNMNFKNLGAYSESLFTQLKYNNIDSIDKSDYEYASIIHDLNFTIPEQLINKFDYIFDGGTIEHIFNIPQVFQNVITALKIDGLFVSVTCNNNFSGHGMYQFSPEIFLSVFQEKYGMEVLELYLAKVNTLKDEWLNVKNIKNIHGRNTEMFSDNEPVYILCIAKKICENGNSLFESPPQQYSYENIDWKK